LLPLTLVSFIGSMAEAAKSCFRGVVAAFDLGEFVKPPGPKAAALKIPDFYLDTTTALC